MENNENKNNKGLIILIVVFGLIVLGLGGWMIYDKLYGNEVKPNGSENVKDNQEENEQNDNTNDDLPTGIIGILVRDYNPFENVDFNEKKEHNAYGKIQVNKNEIVYMITEFEDEVQSKESIKANDVVSAGIVCDCGSCESILYINSKNELYEIDLHNEYKTKKIGDNYTSITVNDRAYVYPSTCDSDDLILKKNNGDLFIYSEGKIEPAKNVERTFVALAGNEYQDSEGISHGDLRETLIFIVSENSKVDGYFLNESKNNIYANVVINTNDEIYVIDENNDIYLFGLYGDYKCSNIGKKYKSIKVKSYLINDDNIEITYSDNTKDKFTGDIFDRQDLIK